MEIISNLWGWLYSGGFPSDLGASLAVLCAALSATAAILLLAGTAWAWVDDKDEIEDAENYTRIAGLCCFPGIPVGYIIGLGIGVIFKYLLVPFPMFWLYVAGAVVIAFLARYSRRIHKALRKHMSDPNAHKE